MRRSPGDRSATTLLRAALSKRARAGVPRAKKGFLAMTAPAAIFDLPPSSTPPPASFFKRGAHLWYFDKYFKKRIGLCITIVNDDFVHLIQTNFCEIKLE
jgi:hypothetical protein